MGKNGVKGRKKGGAVCAIAGIILNLFVIYACVASAFRR